MRLGVLLSTALVVLACDPGYSRRLAIVSTPGVPSLSSALDAFEAHALPESLFRVSPPQYLADEFYRENYEVVRWYDRDPNPTARRGSFDFLAVILNRESGEAAIAVGGFGLIREPPNIAAARDAIVRELCSRNFIVEGGCPE